MEKHLVEAVAEYDDKLLEKFFEDPNSITEAEMHEAVRKAYYRHFYHPDDVPWFFINKGVPDCIGCNLPLPAKPAGY